MDLAVVTTPLDLPAGMEQTPLRRIREVPICAGSYAAALRGPVTLADLSRYPLISLGRNTMTYRLYERWFLDNGLPFRPDIEAATADQILPLVQNDLGIGFVPEDFLAADPQGIRPIPLAVPLPERRICLLQKQDRLPGPAARKFAALLESLGPA